MSWVWDHSRAAPTERLVLLAIADCANDAGSEAYPSMAALVQKTGLSDRSIQRALSALTDLGELRVIRNGGPKGANRYQVTMDANADPRQPVTPRHSVTPTPRRPRQPVTPTESRPTPDTVSGGPRQAVTPTPDTVSPGTVLEPPENRQEPSFGANAPRDEPPTTTDALIGEWIDHCAKRPPNSVIGQVGKQIRAMLSEGIDPADIRRGFALWHSKGLHPSALPSVVNEAMNAPPSRSSPKPSTTDQRVAQALEAGRAVQAMIERGEITT